MVSQTLNFCQYVIFINPQNFDAANILYFTVFYCFYGMLKAINMLRKFLFFLNFVKVYEVL